MLIYGLNPVLEALRAGRVQTLRVSARDDRRVREVLALAESAGVVVERVDSAALDRAARSGPHQGVVADVAEARTYAVAELVAGATGAPLIVVLDGIEDPHNLGAIVRAADAAGVDGLIRQTRHSAAPGAVAAKASAGALAHAKFADVVNVARAIDELKAAGVWVVGLAGEAPLEYTGADFTLPTALVLGAEGAGLRRLVRERCDYLVSVPMRGHVSSLNVSVAAGVVLFEAVRQRSDRRDRAR